MENSRDFGFLPESEGMLRDSFWKFPNFINISELITVSTENFLFGETRCAGYLKFAGIGFGQRKERMM